MLLSSEIFQSWMRRLNNEKRLYICCLTVSKDTRQPKTLEYITLPDVPSYGYKSERVLLESFLLPYLESTECIQYSRRKQEAAASSHNILLCISSSELKLSTLQLVMTRSMTSDFEHSNLMGVTPQMDRTLTLHGGLIFRWPFCPHHPYLASCCFQRITPAKYRAF